jgi:hypothetical protein
VHRAGGASMHSNRVSWKTVEIVIVIYITENCINTKEFVPVFNQDLS